MYVASNKNSADETTKKYRYFLRKELWFTEKYVQSLDHMYKFKRLN